MRRTLIASVIALLVFTVILAAAPGLGATPVGSSVGGEARNQEECLPAWVWANNMKLLEVSERLYVANLADAGIPLAGIHVNARTATIYVGLTEINDKYTQLIKDIVNMVEGVNVQFFKARFTYSELRAFQRKIDQAFWGVTAEDVEKLCAIHDDGLREKMRRELRERIKRTLAETGVPLTMTGVDVQENELMVGLRELRPEYIEAIRNVVGPEVPIEFVEGCVPVESTKRDRHRPLLGGTQIASPLWSTLSFRAVHLDEHFQGIVGFVMVGHVGGVGTRVYQPTLGHDNFVGTILLNPPGPRRSNAAFVANPNTAIAIWPTRSIASWRESRHTPPGTEVRMEGRTSCGTVGVVHRTGVRRFHPKFGMLPDQVLATYTSAPGDSGAPTFGLDGAGRAIIFGVHWGGAIEVDGVIVRTYSPVEGVRADLHLMWGSDPPGDWPVPVGE